MSLDYPEIPLEALFSRLAGGHDARIAVLTPNRRLAQALQRDFDARQAASGLGSWESADILPFDAFVERLWDDALYSSLAAGVPILLSASQEQALWEEAIAGSRLGDALLAPCAAAAQCRQAWRLVHGWRLGEAMARHVGGEDSRAFLEWAGRYVRLARERSMTDTARLCDVVRGLLGVEEVRKPAALALFGFDLLTPQQRGLIDALEAAGARIERCAYPSRDAVVSRQEFCTVDEELSAVARWARARLEADPAARIGIVVPDLAQSRARISRSLARVLHPGYLVEASAPSMAFNVSAGLPLDQFPLVRDALLWLRLGGRGIAFEEVSRVLRSAFLGASESEMAVRARMDAALRERSAVTVTLDGVLRMASSAAMPRAGGFLERLWRLSEHRKSELFGKKGAAQWTRALSDALRIAGFPGERGLDSAEHQTLEKWHELLGEFAALERVTGKMGHAEACGRLERMARETLFQPESPDVPVQVLGILESAGLEFDHLWVLGLTDDAWPLPPRPNAFVPLALQKQAGIPHADAVSSLELDRRITAGWLAAAAEVVLSHARTKDESELAPSPLIARLPAGSLEELTVGDYPSLAQAMKGTAVMESVRDGAGTSRPAGPQPGGTALFRDQAACPFRAFARHRLASEALETPQPGLGARDRGTLLHEMLRLVWDSLRTSARMRALDETERDTLLARCADEAIACMARRRPDALSGRFAALERERLVAVGREWLAFEATRGEFEVIALEDPRPVTFGGVSVNARIDRVDRLAQGGAAVLDYKTGAAAVGAWLGPRPDEPQVPMYALGSGEDVRAVAFARVRRGDPELCGLAMEEGLLPKVKPIGKNRSRYAALYRDWSALTRGWAAELESLGREFLAGDARVSPKDGARTCEHCGQHPFCRVAEKTPDAVADDAARQAAP